MTQNAHVLTFKMCFETPYDLSHAKLIGTPLRGEGCGVILQDSSAVLKVRSPLIGSIYKNEKVMKLLSFPRVPPTQRDMGWDNIIYSKILSLRNNAHMITL